MVRWPLLRPDGLQKSRQLRRGLVLRNWLQFLERAGECVREAPHGSRLELLMHGLKVQLVHTPRQVLRKPQFVLDERLVDQQLCRSRRQLQRLPFFDLLLQRPRGNGGSTGTSVRRCERNNRWWSERSSDAGALRA